MPDYDITITGKRIRNQYKVTFKIDEEIISEEILPFGSEIVYPEVEEKIGYTFSGWGDNTALVVPAEDLIYNGKIDANILAEYKTVKEIPVLKVTHKKGA